MKIVEHRQRLELALDLFNGCAHSCAGCMVEKESGSSLDDLVEIHSLTRELVSYGFTAFDVTLGPTDSMSADNLQEVMRNKNLIQIVELFRAFTLNTSFLEKKKELYLRLCEDVDTLIGEKPIRFLIPAAPNAFKNEKFVNGIKARVDYVLEGLKKAKLIEVGFVVNCTVDTLVDGFESLLQTAFASEFSVPKDDILNIPYGRLRYKDIRVAGEVLNISRKISTFYSQLDGESERTCNPDLDYPTGTQLNLLYNGGKLYWVPFLKDECAYLDPLFEIPKPWTADNVLDRRAEQMLLSLDYVKGTQCETCQYLPSCSEKGITTLMEALSIKDCLVGVEYV